MKPLEPIQFWKREKIDHKSWQPYTRAIGEAAVSWNALQEELSMLFVEIIKPDYANVPLAVWHTIESDRLQRKILLSAARVRLRILKQTKSTDDRALPDIEWLLKKADAVGDARNNAIHSPLTSLTNMATKQSKVEPVTFRGNPRAVKLGSHDLLSEFNWCRDAAIALTVFGQNIQHSLASGFPWPDRPRLPSRGEKKQAPTRDK